MTRGVLLVAAGLLHGLLFGAPLHAQQPGSVRRDSTRADSARSLAPVVVSGTRLSTAADERSPAQVDVLDVRAAPRGPASAAAALERLPGVSVSNDQGSRAQPTLEVRGFSLSPVAGVPQGVSVFLDGVRINEPDAQELNFDLIPMDAIEHAELIRGPTALFGKNTLAGALNLFTARGGPIPEITASADVGKFGEREGHLTASGQRAGFDGYLLVKGSTEDGYRALSGATTRQLFATIGHRRPASDSGAASDSSYVALSVLYAHDQIHEPGSLPESWLRVSRRANYTGGDFFRPDLVQVTARAMQPVPAVRGGQLRGNLFVRRNAIEQYNVNVSDPNTRAFVTNTSLGGTAELDLPLRLAGRSLAVTVGGEYARNNVAYRLFDEPSLAAPSLPADCEALTGLCEDARVAGDDAALYAQGLLQVTRRLSVLISGRGDYVRIPFRDLREPANSGTSTYGRLSPKVGATYAFGEALRGYVSVGSGFRAPAALELACASAAAPCPLPFSLGADPPLRPVVAWNYEAGLDWNPWAAATVELAAFHTAVHDEIAFVTSQTASGYFQNVSRTQRDGLEASLAVRLAAGLRTFGSYTFLDAAYRSAIHLASALDGNFVEPGDRFALSPRHRATLGVGLTHAWAATVLDGTLSARAVSSQFLRGDEANRAEPLPGYAVTDFKLTAQRGRITLSAYVANLFDRQYQIFGVYGENPKTLDGEPASGAPVIERFLTPAYPRTVTVSFSIQR